MSRQCSDDIERIANRLGFSCEHASPVVYLRNPFHLVNWTLPVLELTVVRALYWRCGGRSGGCVARRSGQSRDLVLHGHLSADR